MNFCWEITTLFYGLYVDGLSALFSFTFFLSLFTPQRMGGGAVLVRVVGGYRGKFLG